MPGVNSRYFALGEQSSYDTAVAATRSFEITNDSFVQVFSPEEVGETTRANQQGPLTHNWAQTLEKVEGSIEAAVYRHGQGLLLKNLLGAATTPTAVASYHQLPLCPHLHDHRRRADHQPDRQGGPVKEGFFV